MKIHSLILAFAAGVFLLTSCDDSESPVSSQDTQGLNAEAQADAYFQDVDDLSSALAFASDNTFSGRSAGLDDRFCSAAKVTISKKVSADSDTLTVDFGSEGCTDNRGNLRKGKMIMIYSADRKAGHSISFVDFFINGKKIEGTRTVTRTALVPPTHTTTLTGGKITWPDGTFATREASHTRVWNRNLLSPADDNMVIKQGGTASGINRNGKEYAMEIISDITFRFGCNASGTRPILLPVSGSKVITVGGKTITLDFGDGTCDDKATVTVDGQSKEITLKRTDD